MRKLLGVMALAVSLCMVGTSQAQLLGFGSNNSSVVNRQSPPNKTGFIHPSNQISSPFRLRDLFPSLSGSIRNRTAIGRSNIPDPNTPEYFKAFGFKKLY